MATPCLYASEIKVSTSSCSSLINENVTVDIVCHPTTWIKGWEFTIRFNQTLLSATSVTIGGFFDGYQQFPGLGIIDNANGTITSIYNLIVGKTGNVSTNGTLVYIDFATKAIGEAAVTLYGAGVCNETQYLPLSVVNGSVSIVMQPDNDTDTPPTNNTGPTDEPPVIVPDEPPAAIPPVDTPVDDVPSYAPPGDTISIPDDTQDYKNPIQAFGILFISFQIFLALVCMIMAILSKR